MLSWKMLLLIFAVLSLLGLLTMYGLGITVNRGLLQGFQDGAPAMNTFTMYYADWCGHCKTAKPEFSEFAKQGILTIGNEKCKIRLISPEKEPEAAKGKNIKGFPSFLLETVDGKTVEYSGERNTAGYMSFLNANLGVKADTA
jgi:thiol-disulfide isomerase/thioredoxin